MRSVFMLLALLALLPLQDLLADSASCTILSTVGMVRVRHGSTPLLVTAKRKMQLKVNDAVRTSLESEAVISLSGARIRIRENALVEILSVKSPCRISVRHGKVSVNIDRDIGVFEAALPTGVARLKRGRIHLDAGAEESTISVETGLVTVLAAGTKNEVLLGKASRATVVKGEVRLPKDVPSEGNKRPSIRETAHDTVPIIHGTLPAVARQRKLCFPVVDRTPGEEITFYWSVDGSRESARGQGTFCFELEPGFHTYTVVAEDRAGNRSKEISGEVGYLESSAWNIRVRKRNVVQDDEEPVARVGFSIDHLPGDDMRCIREVRVINRTTGRRETETSFSDHYMEFDLDLKPGRPNGIVIEVMDMNGNRKVEQLQLNTR